MGTSDLDGHTSTRQRLWLSELTLIALWADIAESALTMLGLAGTSPVMFWSVSHASCPCLKSADFEFATDP